MLELPLPFQVDTTLYQHLERLIQSYEKWTGLKWDVKGEKRTQEWVRSIFDSPKAILSHNIKEDPIFNFGNRTALELFEVSFKDLIAMPSRLSAEPMLQEERDHLIHTVRENGYTDSYQGVRISSSGQRFHIPQAYVWNIVDENNQYLGQAACFDKWTFLR